MTPRDDDSNSLDGNEGEIMSSQDIQQANKTTINTYYPKPKRS